MDTREIVVYNEPHECPYLPGRTARLPYRHPLEPLEPAEFDRKLSAGDRRSGQFLYHPECAQCRACEAIRLNVNCFVPRTSQRRTLRRGNELLSITVSKPVVDQTRIDLFNAHRSVRGLDHGDDEIDAAGYAQFLTDTCCSTWEIDYWDGPRLVAAAIFDAGAESLSAVYCFYHPLYRPLSLGTYSVLKQVELCQQTGRRYLYLGYYIAQSPHMSYKALFRPHERLISGSWQYFA